MFHILGHLLAVVFCKQKNTRYSFLLAHHPATGILMLCVVCSCLAAFRYVRISRETWRVVHRFSHPAHSMERIILSSEATALQHGAPNRTALRIRRLLQGPLQSRSEPSIGKHIPAFSNLPDWVSDMRYQNHFLVERQKAIKNHASQSMLQHTVVSCPAQTPASAVSKNSHQLQSDIVFLTSVSQNCLPSLNVETPADTELLAATSDAMNTTLPNVSLSDVGSLHSNNAQGSAVRQNLSRAQNFYTPFRPLKNMAEKSRIVQSIGTESNFGDSCMGWKFQPKKHEYGVSVTRPNGYARGHSARDDGVTAFGAGYGPFGISGTTSAYNEEVSMSVGHENYGMFVDRSVAGRSTGVGFMAPNFETGTLADFADHQYGQRIRIRNFEIAVRHDFDEMENPDTSEFGTEVLVGYNETGLMLVSDVSDKAYGVGLSLRGHRISALHDFDDRISRISATSKRRFQFTIESNLPDLQNEAISAAVGFGLPNLVFVTAGKIQMLIICILFRYTLSTSFLSTNKDIISLHS